MKKFVLHKTLSFVLSVCLMAVLCITPAFTASADAVPIFTSHGMVLDSAIGVIFYVDLSSLSEEQIASCYMTFSVTKGSSDPVSRNEAQGFKRKPDDEDDHIYGFTCFLNTVQLAEDITPTLHYGESSTLVGESYSAKDYIDYALSHSVEVFGEKNAEGVALVKAVADYGHYAQLYLGPKNSWTSGTHYTAIDSYNIAGGYSSYYTAYENRLYEDVKQLKVLGLTQNPSSNLNDIVSGNYKFNLNFDSEVSIKMLLGRTSYINIGTNFTGDYYNDAKYSNYIIYTLAKIPILKLGEVYTVSGNIDGTTDFSVDVSALSYAYTILNKYKNNDSKQTINNVVCAMYDYYSAARAYCGYTSTSLDSEWNG